MNLKKAKDGTDDYFLERSSQERINYQFALYAVHLATGSNLRNMMLTSSAIRALRRKTKNRPKIQLAV